MGEEACVIVLYLLLALVALAAWVGTGILSAYWFARMGWLEGGAPDVKLVVYCGPFSAPVFGACLALERLSDAGHAFLDWAWPPVEGWILAVQERAAERDPKPQASVTVQWPREENRS